MPEFIKKKLSELFVTRVGSIKLTKAFGDQHKGIYPVYSGSNVRPLTYIDTYEYDGTFLTWARNGFAGYMKIIDGKFSINGDRVLLLPQVDYIDLEYIRQQLEPKLRAMAKGRKGEKGQDEYTKVYPSVIDSIEIEVPINESGKPDKSIQKEIASYNASLQELKNKILSYTNIIKRAKVVVENDEIANYRIVPISELFDVYKGSSKYTKAYIHKHSGNYPVFSSQTFNQGVIGMIDSFDYNCECLTWTTDGIYTGTLFHRNGKFSMTTHCGALIPKVDNLNLGYMLHNIANALLPYRVGEGTNKRLGKQVMENIEVKVPVNDKDEYDLIVQEELFSRYKNIFQVKDATLHLLEKILNAKTVRNLHS